MQNFSNTGLNKFIVQNLLKYVPDQIVNKMTNENTTEPNSPSIYKFWSACNKPELLTKLFPVVILIGLLEVIIGLVSLLFIGFYSCDYDDMYDTKDSKLISHLACFGCVILIGNAFVLLFSLLLDSKLAMRCHILVSMFLCLYIFLFSCIKIHFALLVIENDPYKVIDENKKPSILLSTACIIGVITLLGSVIHFISILTVFTYSHVKSINMIAA